MPCHAMLCYAMLFCSGSFANKKERKRKREREKAGFGLLLFCCYCCECVVGLISHDGAKKAQFNPDNLTFWRHSFIHSFTSSFDDPSHCSSMDRQYWRTAVCLSSPGSLTVSCSANDEVIFLDAVVSQPLFLPLEASISHMKKMSCMMMHQIFEYVLCMYVHILPVFIMHKKSEGEKVHSRPWMCVPTHRMPTQSQNWWWRRRIRPNFVP